MIGDLVVEPQEDGVQLRHDAVLVVARIADQRPAARPAGDLGGLRVVGVSRQRLAQQHADPVPLVHVGLVVRPAPVEIVQVETGGTEVRQLPDLIPVQKFTQAGRGVKGEVMINELTQICVGGRYSPVLLGVWPDSGGRLALLPGRHFFGKQPEVSRIELSGGQVWQQRSKAAARQFA